MEAIAPALGEFLGTIITLVVVTLLGYLAPLVRQWLAVAVDLLRVRVGDNRFSQLQIAAMMAVRYAEQAGLNGAIENTARNKLRLALERAQLLLGEAGITHISIAAIEAAVEEAYRVIFVESPVEVIAEGWWEDDGVPPPASAN